MGETTQGRTGNWANRPGGETTRSERESGRNDSGAKGKVGETTRIRFYRILYSDDLQIYTYRKHLSDIGFKVSKIHLKIGRFFFGSVYYKCTESYFYKKIFLMFAEITVKIISNRTPKTFAVITLKFEQDGCTVE